MHGDLYQSLGAIPRRFGLSRKLRGPCPVVFSEGLL